jgi:RNA 2',3'-cyclic 3'-phosphodiesterase
MSRTATARLFVAVELPGEVAERLVRWGREVLGACGPWQRRPRVLPEEALHLTLCFLGSRATGEIPGLARALEPCGEYEGELSLGAPIWLPPRRPASLAIEVRDSNGSLAALQGAVTEALRSVSDWQPRPGRFRPHITVIRSREGPGASSGELPATPLLSFTPESMVLYRSYLDQAGARYEPLATYTLSPGV